MKKQKTKGAARHDEVKKKKLQPVKRLQITLPPAYIRAIDERVSKFPEQRLTRSGVIRLALDLME